MIIQNQLINVTLIAAVTRTEGSGPRPYLLFSKTSNEDLTVWNFETEEERDKVFSEMCKIVERLEHPVMPVRYVTESSPVYGPVGKR